MAKKIEIDQLVSLALIAAANLYDLDKAWITRSGREIIYITKLEIFGISKTKDIGSGVDWIQFSASASIVFIP